LSPSKAADIRGEATAVAAILPVVVPKKSLALSVKGIVFL
jgi:hypothetical protein